MIMTALSLPSTQPFEQQLAGGLDQRPFVALAFGGKLVGDQLDLAARADGFGGSGAVVVPGRAGRRLNAIEIKEKIELVSEPPDVEKAQVMIDLARQRALDLYAIGASVPDWTIRVIAQSSIRSGPASRGCSSSG